MIDESCVLRDCPQVLILDFDWAGTHAEDTQYPISVNPEETLAPGDQVTNPMFKDHDKFKP
jgi:hypothetical protein